MKLVWEGAKGTVIQNVLIIAEIVRVDVNPIVTEDAGEDALEDALEDVTPIVTEDVIVHAPEAAEVLV